MRLTAQAGAVGVKDGGEIPLSGFVGNAGHCRTRSGASADQPSPGRKQGVTADLRSFFYWVVTSRGRPPAPVIKFRGILADWGTLERPSGLAPGPAAKIYLLQLCSVDVFSAHARDESCRIMLSLSLKQ